VRVRVELMADEKDNDRSLEIIAYSVTFLAIVYAIYTIATVVHYWRNRNRNQVADLN